MNWLKNLFRRLFKRNIKTGWKRPGSMVTLEDIVNELKDFQENSPELWREMMGMAYDDILKQVGFSDWTILAMTYEEREQLVMSMFKPQK